MIEKNIKKYIDSLQKDIAVENLKLSSRNIALIATFAALYYVLSLITPYIPAIGISEMKIRLEALMASVFGLILGPFLGALAALLGVFVTWVLPPVGMSPFDAPFLLSPPINAMIVGSIFYRKWKLAFSLLSLLIIAFPLLPPSQPLAQYYYVTVAVVWDKIIALLLILPIVKFSQRLSSPKRFPLLIFLISFIGNQADNMWGADVFAVPYVYGGIFGILDINVVRFLFTVSPFIYPAIRIIQAFFAMIIGVPLIKRLKDTGWIWGEKSIVEF
jgi:uncharacterized membrane protein